MPNNAYRLQHTLHQLAIANPQDDYVVAAHRLDINTSGLLVVARTRRFATYFTKLLSRKTENITSGITKNVVKKYKCLVCIGPSSSSQGSVMEEWN